MKIEIERSYDIAAKEKEAPRFLVDRLWPRGLKKEILKLDLWVKDLSPSNELRKWYNHDPVKWEEFRKSYFEELNRNEDEVNKFINTISKNKKIVLVYSSTEKEINNAVALKEYILKRLK